MKRELKVQMGSAFSMSSEGHKANPDEKGTERPKLFIPVGQQICHKANPDEKGTESKMFAAQRNASWVTKPIPMKRELKAHGLVASSLHGL